MQRVSVAVLCLLCLVQADLTPLNGFGKADHDDDPCNSALKAEGLFKAVEEGDTYTYTSGDTSCPVVCESAAAPTTKDKVKAEAKKQCCKQLVFTLLVGDDDKMRTKAVNSFNVDKFVRVLSVYSLLNNPTQVDLSDSDVVAITHHGNMPGPAAAVNQVIKLAEKADPMLANPTAKQKRMALRPDQIPTKLASRIEGFISAKDKAPWSSELPQMYLRFDKTGDLREFTVRRQTGSLWKEAINTIFNKHIGGDTITIPMSRRYLRFGFEDSVWFFYNIDYDKLLPKLKLKPGALLVFFVCNGEGEGLSAVSGDTPAGTATAKYDAQSTYALYPAIGCSSERSNTFKALKLLSRSAVYDFLVAQKFVVKQLPKA